MSRTIINFSQAAGINFFHFREVLIGPADVIFFQDLQSSVSVFANFFQDQQISDSMGVDCKKSSDSAGLTTYCYVRVGITSKWSPGMGGYNKSYGKITHAVCPMKSLITIKICITYNKYDTCRSIAKWNDDFFCKGPQKHHYCESILYVLIPNNQWAETHDIV